MMIHDHVDETRKDDHARMCDEDVLSNVYICLYDHEDTDATYLECEMNMMI